MDRYDTPYLIYLGLLAVAIGGSFLVANRRRLGTVARQASLWGLIFLGAIAVYGLWSDIRQELLPRQAAFTGGQVEVPRAWDGHYYLTATLNGVPVDFVVDTGASDIVLSMQDAARVGIDVDRLAFTGVAGTANGTVRTARARVKSLGLGPIQSRNVTVSITEGEMSTSLLGMAYLQNFSKIEIGDGKLILTP